MSSSVLTTLNVRVRSGVAFARSRIVGSSCVTVGREARTNGRISSWMIGVVSRTNGRTSRSVGPSARAPGRSACSVGPSSSASAFALASPRWVSSRVEGSSTSVARRFASWRASVSNTAFEFSTNSASWSSFVPSSSITSDRLWMTRLMLRLRVSSAPNTLRP